MSLEKLSDNLSIVLVRPKYSTNIGSCARAMKNMGITKLILVSPFEYDHDTALKLSTHAAADVLENALFYDNLDEALNDFTWCIGTTARLGRQRNLNIDTPEKMALRTSQMLENNKTAVLFGPENKGLENEDLKRCHQFVNIPTKDFASLNLSQAVMIISYELFRAVSKPPKYSEPKLASRFQLDGMYEHLKDILVKIDFANPENPDRWLDNFRSFFSRQNMRAKDVSILRGVLRQITWYGKHMYEKGKNDIEK
jgi:tRNA/rRNA methyltransferase